MVCSLRNSFRLPVLLILLTAIGSPQAQEATDSSAEEIADKAKAKAEAVEATSDLRESVHENLESIQEDAEVAAEVKEKQEDRLATDKQATESLVTGKKMISTPQGSERTPAEQSNIGQPVEKKTLLGHIRSIPGYLQSAPERVPFIRDRGLIFFGRAELDYAYYSSGITKSDSGFRVRSLRVGLAKAFKYNISAKAEVDLTDGDSNFADLYARYRHEKYGLVTVGNQRVAQTLVNQTSRISRTFMEEPLPAEAFGLGRRLALGWDLNRKKGGIHATLFGPDLNGSIGDSGFASRVYFNPKRSRFSVFHIGSSFVYENMSRKTRFFSHPESRVTSVRLVDTGLFDDVSEQRIIALEVAGAKDSFMFRSEFFRATWNRRTSKDPVFRGFYVQANWVLTGESFKYTQGKFLRIRPQNPRGAWEAAVRFSKVDLNDQGIRGGEERNLTLGMNWYAPGNQFRVMANLIFVKTDKYAGNESPTIFQLRAQFHW